MTIDMLHLLKVTILKWSEKSKQSALSADQVSSVSLRMLTIDTLA